MRTQLLEALQNDCLALQGCRCTSLESVGGSSTWRAEVSDGRSLFLKLASPAMLKVEARGLCALKHWADPALLLIPDPLGFLQLGELAVLVLPWLESGRGDQYDLGRGLAVLHRTSSDAGMDQFGWDEEGFIGLGPQLAGWMTSWGDAFVTMRLTPQLQLASKWGLVLDQLEPLLAATRVWLDQHQPQPCLVHGDLWGGNASVFVDGRGILLDPACWWADREVDLAMTRLFGGFSARFYEGYQEEWPLNPGYEDRVDVYNFYHLLNHANLFGGRYKNQCLTAIKAMRSLVL